MQILRASIAFLNSNLPSQFSNITATHSRVRLIGYTPTNQNVVDVKKLHDPFIVDPNNQKVTIEGKSAFTCKLTLGNSKTVNVNSDFVLNATPDLEVYLLKQGWEPFVPPNGYAQRIPEAC
jgi:hypothetical protein